MKSASTSWNTYRLKSAGFNLVWYILPILRSQSPARSTTRKCDSNKGAPTSAVNKLGFWIASASASRLKRYCLDSLEVERSGQPIGEDS